MKRIAIFASGSGSNAENIVRYFSSHNNVECALIVSSSPDAYVLQRAKKLKISTLTITKKMFTQSDDLVKILESLEIDIIVLAGFLWLIPNNLISAFPNKIVNIHPALLPKYGGKGMYGMHVHRAVFENRESETGITIHFVNENYDEGQIIKQAICRLTQADRPEDIATKIHELEFENYPPVIEILLQD